MVGMVVEKPRSSRAAVFALNMSVTQFSCSCLCVNCMNFDNAWRISTLILGRVNEMQCELCKRLSHGVRSHDLPSLTTKVDPEAGPEEGTT